MPLCILLMLPGCAGGVLDPRGPVSAAEKLILLNSLAIMLAIVIPTIIGTLAVAWWFRASNTRARYRPSWSYSGRIELVTWSIPAMVVLLLGGIGWVGSHDLDPPKPLVSKTEPITVQVVSLDWKWLFIYPDLGIASVNRLVVPSGTPISFQLTSATVMNSFFVPQLGGQIYTMAGMTTRLHLQADRPGSYQGLSAQFSGDGFSRMRFTVDAVPDAQFARWAAQAKGGAPVLDAASYAALREPSQGLAPFTYGAVAPGLFDAIVGQKPAPPSADATASIPGKKV
ncbi:ubiquinol oxidase subunit II [Sphingomonas sp. NFR15]|uniref:ubiquinol oxidase subunit II n=1 Tax=Sphingomonas sp. NFR15 TaxID=1566282 RepID=UPI00210E41E0|nr:ubiquinol oxidase subunit II [Sphingomonas sp. NFR15]